MKTNCILIFISIAVFAASDLGAQCSNLQLTANRTTGCAPDIISLILSGAPSGSTYSWTVGNDTKSGKNQLNYTFLKKGVYDVSVSVTFPNQQNCVIKKSRFINIGEVPANLSFNISSASLCQPDTVTFTGPPGMKQYDWLIDGRNNLNSGRILKYKFTSAGTKSVTLRVTDSAGCTALKTIASAVEIAAPPTINFTADVTGGCVPFEVNFKPNVVDGSSKVVSYAWSFPGGSPASSSSAQPPTIKYSSSGSYDVTLKIVTQSSCTFVLEKKALIKAGTGSKPDFTVDKRSGKKEDIFTFHNTTPGVGSLPGNFSWSYSGGSAQSGSDKLKQTVKFPAGGKYTIYLTYDNNGCKTTEKKIDYIEIIDTVKPKPNPCSTVVASYNFSKNDVCTGDSIKITNLSKSVNNRYKWSADKTGITFLPSDTVMEPVVILNTIDTFEVKLLVTGKDTCKAELIKQIRTLSPEATFSSNDTLNDCAPAYVSFTYTGIGADTFYWDFGDGETLVTTSGNIGHIYNTNSGEDLTKGYTVKLMVKTRFGCTGIFERKNFIKVTGPKPDFSVGAGSSYIGTEPLTVTFVNNNAKQFFYVFDYGDNSKTDSNAILPHDYYVLDSGKAFQVYKPKMFVKDQTGCTATGEFKDSVVVYKKPIPDFTDSINYTCENTTVQFTDKSKYAVKWKWDFDNDGKVDDTTQNPKRIFPPGVFKVKLTVANAVGYEESKILEDTVKAMKKPDAGFTISKAEGCTNDTFYFNATNLTADITKTKWVITDGADSAVFTDTSSLTYIFKNSGRQSVMFIAQNDAGCSDTVLKNECITIIDTSFTAEPRISYVTFQDNNSVKITWRRATEPGTRKYYLYKKVGSTDQLLFVAPTENDTVFIDNSVSPKQDNPPAYVLRSGNICGNTSELSKEHIAILLHCTSVNAGSNKLDWSSYYGWSAVDHYEIYRKQGKDSFSLIASLAGNITEYTDNNLCNQEYTYFVKAKSANGIYYSFSNHSLSRPTGNGQPENIQLNYVTVGDDKSIIIEWQPSTLPKTKRYIIDRFTEKTGWRGNYAVTTANIWKDNHVDVQKESYQYRIRVEDECGNISLHSNAGRSILLTSKIKGDRIYLNWRPYGVWDKGIKNQLVQLKLGNNPFRTLPLLDAKDSSLKDYVDYNDPNGSYCYRVIAVENGDAPDSSKSNITCILLPSKLQVPNAFTPNGDGLNDEFKISAHAIHNLTGNSDLDFQMHIYDRNGQKVFETLDVMKGWDGKVRGMDAPEGNYTYMIYAIGEDRDRFYVEGTLTLLRTLR